MGKIICKKTKFGGILRISPFTAEDERGRLVKVYSRNIFVEYGIDFTTVERAYIKSRRNVLRGLHFQKTIPQPRILYCESGKAWFVALNIKKGNANYAKHCTFELNEDMGVYVSGDYAIGTLSLTDTMISIDYGSVYMDEYSAGIRWNDESIGINWPIEKLYGEPIVSEKDKSLPGFNDVSDGDLI